MPRPRRLKPYLIATLASLGIVLPDAVALDLSHNFVEYGVDVLVKNLDARVGAKMAAAALKRNPTFPALLVQAYGDDVAAAAGHLRGRKPPNSFWRRSNLSGRPRSMRVRP